ncbi:MAG: nucleotidyltransferase family protein [Candidatus Melainabacteria bacterium]|nr:nucleotidyltransferase family protein [Candidatus Melainabacteria bacterium]
MKALILAAGLGKRLGLEDIPKPMYKINGKPVLEYNILLLKKHNITDICITLFYKGDVIKNYFADGSKWGVNITYSYEKELLGTSGALLNVTHFLNESPFFVVYGDNYTNTDLSKMFKFHEASKPQATIALFDPEKSLNSGIAGGKIKLDKDNNVISFIEGSGPDVKGYVNSGIYILEREILDMIPKDHPSDFGKDVFPKLLKEGCNVKGYLSDSFVLAIDTKDALSVTENVLKKERGS